MELCSPCLHKEHWIVCSVSVFCSQIYVQYRKSIRAIHFDWLGEKRILFSFCGKELCLRLEGFRKKATLFGVIFCAEEDVSVVRNESVYGQRWRVKRKKDFGARLFVCFWVVSRDITVVLICDGEHEFCLCLEIFCSPRASLSGNKRFLDINKTHVPRHRSKQLYNVHLKKT